MLKTLTILVATLSLFLSVSAQPASALKSLINRTWRNQDTTRAGVHKFHISSSGTADLFFYDSTGILKEAILAFDRVIDNYALFKACDSSRCFWFSVSTSGVGAIAGIAKLAGTNVPLELIFRDSSGHVSGHDGGSLCPPSCSLTPGTESLMYFGNVSCCINRDHPKHHCGSTDDELATLSKKFGCIFDN